MATGIKFKNIVKLWENKSPTTNFAAQTVSLDLTEYDAIIMTNVATTGSATANAQNTLLMKDGCTYACISQNVTTGTRYTYNRSVSVNDTGVTFSTGYRAATAGANYFIPLAIYGVRF